MTASTTRRTLGADSPASQDTRAGTATTRGLTACAETRHTEGLADYLTADRLVPRNPLVAYLVARTFTHINSLLDTPAIVQVGARRYPHSRLPAEALPRYRLAASLGHGTVRSEAARMVAAIERWLQLQPAHAPAPGQARKAGGR